VPVRDERKFRLPGRARVPWWPWLLAIVVHVPIVFILVERRLAPAPPYFGAHDIIMSDSARAVPMPYPRAPRSAAPVVHAPAPASLAVAPRVTPVVRPTTEFAGAIPPVRVDSPPTGAAASLQPRYGNGRLWVAPMVASPREVARTLTGKTDKQLNDSIVTAMVQAYLDAMAKEQAESPTALPSWTTKIGGKTVGIDPKWIYLGPLKIPTILLALLPINVQANPTEAAFNRKLQVMRADLFEAARRAENYDEFKKAVKDLHDQTERAREFKKNQRTPPDTSGHG
jgi:hypothetical protein